MMSLLPDIHIIYIFFTRFFVAEGCSDGALSGSAALLTLKRKDNLVAYTLLQAERQKEGQEPEQQTGYKAIVNPNYCSQVERQEVGQEPNHKENISS
jgi:hypothetical protein